MGFINLYPHIIKISKRRKISFLLKMQTGKAKRVSEEARTGRVVDTKNGTSIRELFGSRSTDDGGENLCSI